MGLFSALSRYRSSLSSFRIREEAKVWLEQ